jgi:hypothetical protein
MDTLLHSYLCKLKIIAKLPENGRFDTSNNDITIYANTLYNWARRKIIGYSKEDTTKYLVELYREIKGFADQIMYNIATEHNTSVKISKMSMLISLAEKIKESLTGIKNLIDTYKGFYTTVSRLECLEQDIITPLYIAIKFFIPSQYHTKVLRSSLINTRSFESSGKAPPIYETPSAPPADLHSMRSMAQASQTTGQSMPMAIPKGLIDKEVDESRPRSNPINIPHRIVLSQL